MVYGVDLFLALFNNLAIFIALVTIYGNLLNYLKKAKWYNSQIILGVLFGIFAVGCMYARIPVFKGVIVDQRNAIVALSGIFGGPASAIISAVFAGSFRLYLGGDGAIGGFIGVNLAAASGILLNRFSRHFDSIHYAATSSFIASIIILPGFLFIGDFQTGWQLMKAMAIPYGAAIFLGIFLCGFLLHREETRHRMESLFRESEEKYRELIEGTRDLITHTDKHGNFTFVNHVAEEILGLSPQECIGVSAFNFIHPDDRDKTIEWFEDCIARKTRQATFENRQVNSRTGKAHTVLWSSAFRFDNSGALAGVGSIARDFTEQKQAQEAVRASEARYRTLFECVPDGILIADLNDRCLDANPKMCSMLGYTSEEVIGLNASAMILGQGIQCVESVSGPIRGESSDIRQLQFRRKDGATFPAEVVTTAIPDDNLMIMVRDISQRKQLEAHLLQAQKMESIGRLAGGIAHDFNNLLVPIIGYADLWMMKLPADSPIYADLQKMREAADRAAGLTRQILAFSRKQLLEMQIIDLNVIITEFKSMIHRLIGEDIELETFLDHALYPVKADKVQIEQVLLNLVINAREAMPSGGKMTIETANTYLDETYVKRHAGDHLPGQYIMLAVSDTGQGMDSDTQRRAFEPFFTTKEPGKGTGLGLATVFGIVKQHRGSIWVYSEPGKGATFKIYLPQAEGIVEMPVAEEAYSPHYGTETVLVVEDEDMVRKLVCETLAAHGYDILEAQTPNTGLQLISTRKKIDLLLTDVVMPEMNGRELYEKVTEIQPTARVLFMSGYTDNVIVHHGILDASVNFLQKPFTIQGLVGKVRLALSQN